MKYWKKSNGRCGMMDNDGYVPNSIEIKKFEYDIYVSSLPKIEYEKSDIEKLIEWAKKEGHI